MSRKPFRTGGVLNLATGEETKTFSCRRPWYLQLLTDKNLNYVRNWSESAFTASPAGVSPLPYKRVSGYGNASDGGEKFDLYQFEQSFFDRMRARAIDLGNRGVYISYMLFDVYGFESPQNRGVV